MILAKRHYKNSVISPKEKTALWVVGIFVVFLCALWVLATSSAF